MLQDEFRVGFRGVWWYTKNLKWWHIFQNDKIPNFFFLMGKKESDDIFYGFALDGL